MPIKDNLAVSEFRCT